MSSAPASARDPLDIVVVDDNLDGAEMLADLLALSGHAVRVATLGIDAVRLLEEQPPHVLFLDLGVPELDGYELARLARARYGQAIRVVAVTGFDTKQARALCDWAGFDAFIAKPYHPTDIQRCLRPLAGEPG